MKNQDLPFNKLLVKIRKANAEFNTQEKLAAKIGENRAFISLWERGQSLPDAEQFMKLCEIFNDPLFKEVGEKALTEEKERVHYARLHPKVKLCLADDTLCWRCNEKMHTAYGMVDDNPISPDGFNETMLKIAKEKGVIIEPRYSKTTDETHLANVCPHCGTFIGEFFMHELWYGETEVIDIEDVEGFAWDDTKENPYEDEEEDT